MSNLNRLISLLERSGKPDFFPEEDLAGSFLNPLQTEKFNDRTEFNLFVGPSFKKEDLQLVLEDGSLVVSGESSEESENGISHASINCSWNVPDSVKQEDVSAKFNDGTLTITVKGVNEGFGKPGIKIN